jgi:uncharacterized OB-fold protein
MSGAAGLADLWTRGLEEGVLRIPRCADCAAWNWYPSALCPKCRSARLVWTPVSPQGRVYSWTRVHRSFTGAPGDQGPFVIGLIVPEDAPGVRIVCRQVAGEALPRIDDRVVMSPLKKDDQLCWGFRLHR